MNCVTTYTDTGLTLVKEFHGSCVKLSFVKVSVRWILLQRVQLQRIPLIKANFYELNCSLKQDSVYLDKRHYFSGVPESVNFVCFI